MKKKASIYVLAILILAMLITIIPSTTVYAATIPPDNAKYHQTYSKNGVSFPAGYCTAYAAIRFSEIAQNPGVDWSGHAYQWYYNASKANSQYVLSGDYKSPVVGSIIVWTGGTWGHVAIVERVDQDGILISEMNWRQFNVLTNEKLVWSRVLNRGSYKFKGYIYPYRKILYTLSDPKLSKSTIKRGGSCKDMVGNTPDGKHHTAFEN